VLETPARWREPEPALGPSGSPRAVTTQESQESAPAPRGASSLEKVPAKPVHRVHHLAAGARGGGAVMVFKFDADETSRGRNPCKHKRRNQGKPPPFVRILKTHRSERNRDLARRHTPHEPPPFAGRPPRVAQPVLGRATLPTSPLGCWMTSREEDGFCGVSVFLRHLENKTAPE